MVPSSVRSNSRNGNGCTAWYAIYRCGGTLLYRFQILRCDRGGDGLPRSLFLDERPVEVENQHANFSQRCNESQTPRVGGAEQTALLCTGGILLGRILRAASMS